MKVQVWNAIADSGDLEKVLGTVTTSMDATAKIARAKAAVRYMPDGFSIGWKLKVKKSSTREI
jgi:hypothetical protein